MLDPEPLGPEELREVDRFRWALELESNFAFHLIVADTLDVLNSALARLGRWLEILRPRPPRNPSYETSATLILAALDQRIEAARAAPLLVDAMIAHRDPAWAIVFRRLNELRNGIEQRHRGPLLLAVTPSGETLFGREAPDLWSRRGSGMRLRDHRPIQPGGALPELLLPPSDPSAFESLCFELFREIWNDPGAQKNARVGQPQAGVDIFGRAAGRWVGVQCKHESRLPRGKLTLHDIEREVRKTRAFIPTLAIFILATTAPEDDQFRQFSPDSSAAARFAAFGVEVQVWFWDDIWQELRQRRELLGRISLLFRPLQKISASRLPLVPGPLFGRDDELAKLDSAWGDREVHVLTLIGEGGAGKTSLVANWSSRMAANRYEGADYFDWSFYNDGYREQGGATADAFTDAALRFFGDAATAESSMSPWEKGSQLARLIAQRKTLLILDGLETLQHPHGPLAGAIKDPRISALLKGLAAKNPGLCVVTSRQSISDLASFHSLNAPELALDRLPLSAGVEMLRTLGVHGPLEQLQQLVEEVHGHTLSLNLVGSYLVYAHEGDVRRRDKLHLTLVGEESSGQLPRMFAAYENSLASGGDEGLRLLSFLRILSLFDRSASNSALNSLRQLPAIPGLTEPLVSLSDEQWVQIISRLAETGLLSPDFAASHGTSLTAHPLVREYFSRQLRSRNPAGWRAAHGRLFEYFAGTTDYRPNTLEGLQPLYQAVVHGCHAGRMQEALNEVFRDRILRRSENTIIFWIGALALGANLDAIACFFDPPWSRVSPSLPETDKSWLLNQAGLHLRAMGRLTEALEPIRSGLRSGIEGADWKGSSILGTNLVEIEVALGELSSALHHADEAISFADRGGDVSIRVSSRTAKANVLHQAGQRNEALVSFREAERIQAEWLPEHPLLSSMAGFQYCELLLANPERAAASGLTDPQAIEECRAVERRVAHTLERSELNRAALLDIAFGHLTLGRARFYRAILEGSTTYDAKGEIETAVDGLRRAGHIPHLALGLITRAWLRSLLGDEAGSREDLAEAQDIAERGPMPLLLADIHLQHARHFHDSGALAEARRLIEEHRYGRRLEELADLEAMASGWQAPTNGH
ncbi:MAG: hypothetical protein ABJC13_25445 [Acidobacteriota bacterium]